MGNYCIVISGEVTWGPGPLPERMTLDDGTTRTSLDELTAEELLAINLWPVTETVPSYDQNSQRLAFPPTLTVDTDHVNAVYTVENLPSPSAQEARTVAKKERGMAAWTVLATALDVPLKINDLDLARRIKAATAADETFPVEVEGETLVLTPAEIAAMAKDARMVYIDNGGDFETLEDPAPTGIDFTLQFEFHPGSNGDYLPACIVRLIRAQWHTTGYDLPPTANFQLSVVHDGYPMYDFKYVGDWCVTDGYERPDLTATRIWMAGTEGCTLPAGVTNIATLPFSATSVPIFSTASGDTFTSHFTWAPSTAVTKVVRVISYNLAICCPANLCLNNLPTDEKVNSSLQLAQGWPSWDPANWSAYFMGASTQASYCQYYAEYDGIDGHHYQLGTQHSWQGLSYPPPDLSYMGGASWPSGSNPATHLVTVSCNYMGGATAEVWLAYGENNSSRKIAEIDPPEAPTWDVYGADFSCT